ncbi:hypothetical protein [Glycomyces sp. MUSA5-2]|uniref:hypothetical protein n=1 Tax=Glycomyces sp. MUSA5-2 TaxID=2053002 RepID=UPI0030081B8A
MEPVEVAGYRLRFEVDGVVVKVVDDAGDYVGYAHSLDRQLGPLFNPGWKYHKDLGTRADDPRGADKRDAIARRAKEVRDAAAG